LASRQLQNLFMYVLGGCLGLWTSGTCEAGRSGKADCNKFSSGKESHERCSWNDLPPSQGSLWQSRQPEREPLLDPLENRGDPLPHANAHRGQSELRSSIEHVVDERRGNASATGA